MLKLTCNRLYRLFFEQSSSIFLKKITRDTRKAAYLSRRVAAFLGVIIATRDWEIGAQYLTVGNRCSLPKEMKSASADSNGSVHVSKLESKQGGICNFRASIVIAHVGSRTRSACIYRSCLSFARVWPYAAPEPRLSSNAYSPSISPQTVDLTFSAEILVRTNYAEFCLSG